ncbi:MAG: hypothetical protein GY705_18865 [Bacteroidetes bacterium]|nr:hypothetical protein [Bacteroidota bacterium]
MNNGIFTILVLCIFSTSVIAQEKTLEEICEQTLCRKFDKYDMVLPDGKTWELGPTPEIPIAFKDRINIWINESIQILVSENDGEIENYIAVTEDIDLKRTISINLKQIDLEKLDNLPENESKNIANAIESGLKFGGRYQTMLTIKNPFDGHLDYSVELVLKGNETKKATTCEIIPNGSGTEFWPEPIYQVLITNLSLRTDKAITGQPECDY